MALPDPLNQISISQINTQLGVASNTADSRLASREGYAMTGLGPAGTGPYSVYSQGLAGICMPNQLNIAVTRPNPPTSTAVYYSGPSSAWRPSQMREFHSAYGNPGSTTNKPQFTGTSIGETGNNATGTVTLTFNKGEKASVVYVAIQSGSSVALAWTAYAGTSTGAITINRDTTYIAYIQDQWGCGGNREFASGTFIYNI